LILAVTVGDAIVLRSGGQQSESENKSTLIPADSPLCGPLGRMQPGQKVVFDGMFLRDKAKGPNKGGLAGNRSFEQPEFAFQVLKIRAQKPQSGKSWKEIVAATRNQILALHN